MFIYELRTYKAVVSFRGMLDNVVILDGLAKLMVNFALKEGSSKQGKALLASVGENCVLAAYLKIFYNKL